MAGAEPEPVAPLATQGAPSADDLRFYYLENDQRSSIYEVVIGGDSRPRQLNHLPPVKPGHWFIRGKEIIYADKQADGRNTPVFQAAIEGGPARLLFRLPIRPDDVHDVSISGDLSEVAWSCNHEQEDVWIIEGFS